MKYIKLGVISLVCIAVFMGCESDNKKSNEHPQKIEKKEKNEILVNGKSYSYDKLLLSQIDKTIGMDKKHPPTVKTITPNTTPHYTIEIKDGEHAGTYRIWAEGLSYLVDIKKKDATLWTGIQYDKAEELSKTLHAYGNPASPIIYRADDILGGMKIQAKNGIEGRPVSEPFYIKEAVEQEHMTLKTEKEQFFVYQGISKDDAVKIKQILDTKLQIIDFVYPPRTYQIHNLVVMYVPNNMKYTLEPNILAFSKR